MALKTYWEMFEDIVDQVWLTNTFNDWETETRRIKRDINDIQKEALSISKTYLKKAWVLIPWGTVADQKEYTIPTNVDKITLVQVTVDSRDYFPAELWIQDFNRLANTEQTSDIPVYFTVDKTKLVLYPNPLSNGNAIELNANAFATDLNTDPSVTTDQGTTLEIKEGYKNVIYYYVLSEAFSRLEDFASADRYERKQDKIMVKYKDEVRNPTNSVVVKHGIQDTVDPNRHSVLT
jgi:hypothetical protein